MIFMLPAIKALSELGADITLCAEGDFPTAGLFRRCRYAKRVTDGKERVQADFYLSGNFVPPSFSRFRYPTVRAGWTHEPQYPEPEWSMSLGLARRFGWRGERPDVSDWCHQLDRTPRWDVGIIPGCKPGPWIRKRWPGMAQTALQLLSFGLRVAIIGKDDAEVAGIPGERVEADIRDLPDLLAGCRIIIGTDSGPAHLASSLGVPLVMLFTATNETKGDPVGRPAVKLVTSHRCRPCQSTLVWGRCQNWLCRDIPVASVISQALGLLNP